MTPCPLDDTLRGAGVRLDWSEVPVDVRRGIEQLLGSDVVESETQRGGFSPGVAARVRLRDDRRLFIKAVGAETNAEAPEIYWREALVASGLPETVPTPRFLASYDQDGWVALVFEDVQARLPQLPWQRAELARVVAAVGDLTASLTPSPLLRSIGDDADRFAGFRELRALAASGEGLDDLDGWVVRNLDRLAELHDGWSEATRGETLLHCDIRADNLLLTTEGRVLVVDWPWATVGASWIDLLFMLPSVAMQGGPAPWRVFDEHALARQASVDSVTVALAGLTGMLVSRARQPDPPGLPTLRRFQRAQGAEGVRWLRRRTSWR